MSFTAKENLKSCVVFSCHISFISFHLEQFLSLSSYFMTLAFKKNTDPYFVECPQFGLSCFLFFFNYLFIYLFIYLFMAVLGLHPCARALSSCGERGPLFTAVRRPLTIAASPVAEHRLQTLRLSNCGPRAQSLRGMWDLPRPGLEPVSPALAGRLSTTAPPGKPCLVFF